MSKARERGNHFNLMRLGLALLVLLSHAPELVDNGRKREILSRIFHTMSFGEFAVNGFFFISGYLITQSWDRTPAVWDFLRKRVLRIYPGFIVACLVSVVVVGYLTGAPGFFSELKFKAMLKSVVFLAPPDTPAVFAGLSYADVGPNGALWTIQYEFRCYLLVLLLGVTGILKQRRVVAATLVSSLVLVFFPGLSALTFPKSWLVLGNLWELTRFLCFFLSGATCYLFRDRIALRKNVALVAVPLLVLCMCSAKLVVPGLAIFGGYILLWFAFRPMPLLDRLPLKTDISYGVYLYGWPTQQLLCWYFRGASPWFVFAASVLICCVLGALSWILIEQPFLRLKPKNRNRETPNSEMSANARTKTGLVDRDQEIQSVPGVAVEGLPAETGKE